MDMVWFVDLFYDEYDVSCDDFVVLMFEDVVDVVVLISECMSV